MISRTTKMQILYHHQYKQSSVYMDAGQYDTDRKVKKAVKVMNTAKGFLDYTIEHWAVGILHWLLQKDKKGFGYVQSNSSDTAEFIWIKAQQKQEFNKVSLYS